jgi:hypothetical protein
MGLSSPRNKRSPPKRQFSRVGKVFWENANFLRERLKFPNETFVSNIFAIKIISYLFLYKLATSHWKRLKETNNFVGGNTSIKIHMKKLSSHKVSNTFVPWGTCLFSQAI